MDFVAIKYTGRKPYRDRTSLKNEWVPGSTKLVPTDDAKALLRFAEFSMGKFQKDGSDLEQARQAKRSADSAEAQNKRTEVEILDEVAHMDKDALEAYALKYGTDLDKRQSLDTLRTKVASLIEIHGAL